MTSRKPQPTLEELGLDEPVQLRPATAAEPKQHRPEPPTSLQRQPGVSRPTANAATGNASATAVGNRLRSLAVGYLAQGAVVGGKGCFATYFALWADTTVESDFGSGRIHNSGLIADQLVTVIAGSSMTIVGAMLLIAGVALTVVACEKMKDQPLTVLDFVSLRSIALLVLLLVAVIFGDYLVIGVAFAMLFFRSLVCLCVFTNRSTNVLQVANQ